MSRMFKRDGVFYADIHYEGRRIRRSLRTNKKKLAEKRFAELARRVGTGEESVDKVITFEEFVGKFIRYISMDKKKRTIETYKSVLGNFSTFLASAGLSNSKLYNISTKEILEKYKIYRRNDVEPATINNELAVLRRFFNVAIAFKHLRENPVRQVEKLRQPKRQRRVFTISEAELIFSHSSKKRRELYEFLLHSCLRIMEAIHLTWEDIDWERGIIKVQDKLCDCHRCDGTWSPKSYEAREIPLNSTMKSIIERQNRFSRWVFSNKYGSILNRNHVWQDLKRVCTKLGIPGATLHNFRHTGATLHAKYGTPVAVLQKILGHKNLATTQIYFHLDAKDTASAIHAFERMIDREKEFGLKTGT